MTAAVRRVIRPYTREHAAAVHVLAAPCIWRRAAAYGDDHGQVDWPALDQAAGPWSSGERLLVHVAEDLYCGAEEPASLARLCGTLDTGNLRRVVEAVCMLRPDVAPPQGWAR
jgi:hypothetical protein